MLRLRGITVDCAEPSELAGFWAGVLGYELRSLWEPYAGAKDSGQRDPNLTFQRDRSGHGRNHLHLDLYSDAPEDDVADLVARGAQRVRRLEEGDTWWWVLRDPAGNEFCVIAAMGADRAV